MFTSIDSAPSIQKSIDYSHVKSRSIDNSFDKKSLGSLASLNTSSNSIQPSRTEQDVRLNYSNMNVSNNNIAQNVRQGLPVKTEPPSFDKWIKKDGPLKLQEALANLNLDIKSVNKVNLSAFTYEQLQNEKKNVKNELKNYDAAFTSTFRRPPEREEKEPMRPLYIYYKKIKQYIIKSSEKSKANKVAASTMQGSGAQNMGNMGNMSSANVSMASDKGSRTLKPTKGLAPEKENKIMPERKLETSFEVQMSRDNFKGRGGDYNMGNGDDRMDFEIKNSRQQIMQRGQGNMYNNGLSQEQMRRQLEEYRNIRQQLRERLHLYQTEFTRNNNRRIKYQRDIAPVEEEYKRYKDIKHEINRLENLLNAGGEV